VSQRERTCATSSIVEEAIGVTSDSAINADASQAPGITQSRVSDLTRGKWEKFSLEVLITLATKAGMHVTLKIAA